MGKYTEFIARTRVRFLLGSAMANITVSFVTLLTFLKVYEPTLNFYHIPIYPLYALTPISYAVVCWWIGLWYQNSGIWQEEATFGNKNLNPEFLEIYESMKEIKKALNIPEKKT